MNEFSKRLKGMSLASISGTIEGLSYALDGDFHNDKTAEISERLRSIADELFNRAINSQRSHMTIDNEMCSRALARTIID